MARVRYQKTGFTLVELLIAITIGLLVVSVASSVLLSTVRDNVKIRDSAMLQESAFFTSHLVRQHLRQAGFKNIDSSLVASRRIPIPRNDEVFAEITGSWLQGQYLKADANSISFRFSGSSNSSGVADGSIIDCAGNAVAENVVSDISLSLIDKKLVCSSAGTQQILIGSDDTLDVDSLTITLGVDTGGDGSIDQYVDSAAATSADFAATREILLRLVFVSNQRLDAKNHTYLNNGSEVNHPDDYYRREVVIRTWLRNAMTTS